MDLEGILKICEMLKLGTTEVRDHPELGPQISISCPLAPFKHKDKYDANHGCSVKIVEDGPSLVRCFSGNCAYKGTWADMLEIAFQAHQDPKFAETLREIKETEKETPEAKIKRNNKAIAKLFAEPVLKGCEDDKDVLPEDLWTPYKNPIPQYALDRGITAETYEAWGLGYCPIMQRLIFPVRRRDGKLVGFQGRDTTGKASLPHFNIKNFNRTKYLLGEHLLIPGQPIVIVEGAVGTVKTWQALHHVASVVGSLGEGFGPIQADKLAELNPPCVYIFMDGDGPGRTMASKAHYIMHGRFPLRLMECPTDIDETGKKKYDPGNLLAERIVEIYDSARPVLDRVRWTLPLPVLPR